MNRPPPIDAQAVFSTVKEVKKALNRRGYRPGNMVLLLDPVNDDIILGTTDDMTLDDGLALLRIGLRGGQVQEDGVLKNEVITLLGLAKLPQAFAIIAEDRHGDDFILIAEGVPGLGVVAGEGMFQIGRLVGRLDAGRAIKRMQEGQTNPSPTVKVAVKEPAHKRVLNWFTRPFHHPTR